MIGKFLLWMNWMSIRPDETVSKYVVERIEMILNVNDMLFNKRTENFNKGISKMVDIRIVNTFSLKKVYIWFNCIIDKLLN